MTAQSSIRDMFFEEGEELLEALGDGLALMQSGQRDDETVNAVFRAVHSIKGGAGAFNLAALVAFAHRFETVLDEVRSHRLTLDFQVMHALQRSADHLTDLMDDARKGTERVYDQTAEFLAALDACLGRDGAVPPEVGDAPLAYVPLVLDLGDLSDPATPQGPQASRYEITFCPHAALCANGHDPALFLAALAELGSAEVQADLSRLPDFSVHDPAEAYLGWTIHLRTESPLN